MSLCENYSSGVEVPRFLLHAMQYCYSVGMPVVICHHHGDEGGAIDECPPWGSTVNTPSPHESGWVSVRYAWATYSSTCSETSVGPSDDPSATIVQSGSSGVRGAPGGDSARSVSVSEVVRSRVRSHLVTLQMPIAVRLPSTKPALFTGLSMTSYPLPPSYSWRSGIDTVLAASAVPCHAGRILATDHSPH